MYIFGYNYIKWISTFEETKLTQYNNTLHMYNFKILAAENQEDLDEFAFTDEYTIQAQGILNPLTVSYFFAYYYTLFSSAYAFLYAAL